MRIVILVACLWLATPPLWGKIVFYSDRDGNYEIYTMNADGSNQTRLTFNQAGDFAPAWSPNGRQIVFASFRHDEHLADIDLDEHNAEIYVMDADGSNQRQLTHHHGWDGDPDWSPDGSQIAFNSDRNSGRADLSIFVMDADGGNVRQVTDTLVAQRPKWSPDGEWILFMEDDVFAIRPDGTDLWRVSEPKPDTGSYLGGWSSDGKQILYEETNFDLDASTPIIATLHPAAPQRVLKRLPVRIPLKDLSVVSFSADGQSIFFGGIKNDDRNIYRFGLVDKQLIQLTNSPGSDASPQEWNPRLSVWSGKLTPTLWGEIKTTK